MTETHKNIGFAFSQTNYNSNNTLKHYRPPYHTLDLAAGVVLKIVHS